MNEEKKKNKERKGHALLLGMAEEKVHCRLKGECR